MSLFHARAGTLGLGSFPSVGASLDHLGAQVAPMYDLCWSALHYSLFESDKEDAQWNLTLKSSKLA